jgi:oligopeptide transport system substrate-binding protein
VRLLPWSLALIVASVAACRPGTEDGYFGTTERSSSDLRTFYLNNSDEPETLDPGLASDRAATTLINELFEGLTVLDPADMRPTPGVAVRYDQSADNRRFRFFLREDARWSDGRPVTAADFVYAWHRVLAPGSAARMATMLYRLKNAKLHHRGKLRRVASDQRLRAEPARDAAPGPALAAGTAVQVVATAPAEVAKLVDAEWARVEALADAVPFAAGAERDADGQGAEQEPPPSGWVPTEALKLAPELVGVRATAERTLEVELAEPTPYFLELLSYPTYFPVRRDLLERFAAAGQPDRWYRPEHIVVNGPYTLDQWRFRYEIRMKQNPHYHGRDRLKIHRIVWLEVADHHANMNLYKTGEIDFIGSNVSLPAAYMESLSQLADFRRSRYLASYYYALNVAEPPLDDVRVRRALNLGVDKQLLIDTVTRSGQLPATHIVPDYTGSGYAEAARADQEAGRDPFAGADHRFDPERARALLGEAGYPVEQVDGRYRAKGFGALEILYNTSEGHRKIAVAVQDMWKRHLGITVTLRNEEWKVMLKNMQGGRYQVARFSWTADYNHPHSFLETLLSYSPQNWTGWKSAEFDALLERAAATADPAASIARYRQAEQLAVDGMPLLPLYFYTKSTLVKPYVQGFYESPKNEHLVRFLWLDPDWKGRAGTEPAYPVERFPPPGEF